MYMYRTEFNENRQIDLVREKITWTGRTDDMYCSSETIYDLCTENLKMNLGLADVGGSMMVVSNFTLYADCSHGRRPDFFHAARPEVAIPVYEAFLREIRARNIPLITGEFGADMYIDHVNDGPVTLILDTDQMMKK